VILKRADGAFGRIATMYMGRHKLVVDIVGREELLESGGGLVIQTLQARCEATCLEEMDGPLISGKDVRARARRHGFCMHIVAVEVIDNEEILVALAGGRKKATREVGTDLARRGVVVDVDVVGADRGDSRRRRSGRCNLCRAEIGALLVHVALQHGD
jgi:hypothetical protein